MQVETHQITKKLWNLKGRGMYFYLEKSFQTEYSQNPSNKQTCITNPQTPNMHMLIQSNFFFHLDKHYGIQSLSTHSIGQ